MLSTRPAGGARSSEAWPLITRALVVLSAWVPPELVGRYVNRELACTPNHGVHTVAGCPSKCQLTGSPSPSARPRLQRALTSPLVAWLIDCERSVIRRTANLRGHASPAVLSDRFSVAATVDWLDIAALNVMPDRARPLPLRGMLAFILVFMRGGLLAHWSPASPEAVPAAPPSPRPDVLPEIGPTPPGPDVVPPPEIDVPTPPENPNPAHEPPGTPPPIA